MVFHCVAPFHSKGTPIFHSLYRPPARGAWGGMDTLLGHRGKGTLEDLKLIATIWLNQLAFPSCLLIVFTNHRNILALPWQYIQYLEIRCLANSPLGSSQNKMNNSSTSVRLKRQRLFICANPFSFLESEKSQNIHCSGPCIFHCQGGNSK